MKTIALDDELWADLTILKVQKKFDTYDDLIRDMKNKYIL